MSDDFDKEAERERLREKYEADQEDREATERMSQLLLQGATMTNKHCDTCGTPIFRHEGQEFCPTCQRRRAEAKGTSDQADETTDTAGEAGPSAEAAGEPGAQGDDPASPDVSQEAEQAGQQPGNAGEPAEMAGNQAGKPRKPVSQGSPQAKPAGQGHGNSLDEARASLVRSITALSQRAERTDDPRQAKELLSAAREAAETLSQLRGN